MQNALLMASDTFGQMSSFQRKLIKSVCLQKHSAFQSLPYSVLYADRELMYMSVFSDAVNVLQRKKHVFNDIELQVKPEIELAFDDSGSDGECTRSGGEERAGESCTNDISLRLYFYCPCCLAHLNSVWLGNLGIKKHSLNIISVDNFCVFMILFTPPKGFRLVGFLRKGPRKQM